MEVLQTKIWTAMPLRPLGSPAPHKVCSPYRQTQSTRSEQQAGEQGQPCFSPLPTSLLGLTPSRTSHTATSLSLVIPFVKCVGTANISPILSILCAPPPPEGEQRWRITRCPGSPTYTHKVHLILRDFWNLKRFPSQLDCSKQKTRKRCQWSEHKWW